MENQNVNNVNEEVKTTAEVDNSNGELKIEIETSNSKDQTSDSQKPKIEVKKENEEEIQHFTPKALKERLERNSNMTRKQVEEELKKEFEEKLKKELDKSYKELEKTKSESFKIKENNKIMQELYKNQVDPDLDEDEMELLINKIKKQKTDDIEYSDIIKNLKESKSKYFKNTGWATIKAPVNNNPIKNITSRTREMAEDYLKKKKYI